MDSRAVRALTRLMVGAVIVMAMGWPLPPALAHAALVKTEPPRRAVLDKAPTQVRLWFNEEIEGAYSSLAVLDAEKHPVTEIKPQPAPDDRKSHRPAAAGIGTWKVFRAVRVLSVDGHVVKSSFGFTVKGKVQGK